MEQRQLGNSGLSVSVLSFGTMTIGGRDRFAKIVSDHGVNVSVRKSRGRDIRAACGQLIVEGPKKSAAQQLAVVM
jgi:aryl-alcohol dehydrogenase-like predicted oxidoreductase